MINIAVVTAVHPTVVETRRKPLPKSLSKVCFLHWTVGGKKRGIQIFECVGRIVQPFLKSNTSQCLIFFEQNTNLGLMDDVFISHPNETLMMVFLDEEAEAKRPTFFWHRSWEGCGILSPNPLETSDATWQVVWVPHFTLFFIYSFTFFM